MPPPKDVHVLIPETCEYVTLHGKRDFTEVIKLGYSRWGVYSGLSAWVQCNHKGPKNCSNWKVEERNMSSTRSPDEPNICFLWEDTTV